MTRDDIELLQSGLLMQLHRAQPHCLRVRALHLNSKLLGSFNALAEDTVRERLDYLETKGMVVRKNKALSPENVEYRITESGIVWLDENNLI